MLTQESSPEESTVLDEKYKILKLITKSGYNKIYLAYNIKTNEQFVIKMSISRFWNFNLCLLESQVKFHKKIESENVVKLIEEKVNGKKRKIKKETKNCRGETICTCHYIVLEYAAKGEMFNYVKLNKGVYYKVAMYYFQQLIQGIEDMHRFNVCHRDIKLDNMLLDENFKLKIADLEFSQEIKNERGEHILHTDKQGTFSYMAPEFFNFRPFTYDSKLKNSLKIYHTGDKVDIFAAGVVLFILLTGMLPFESAEKYDKNYKFFFENNHSLFWQNKKFKNIKSNIPDSAKDLINKMLEPNADKRITIEEIKNHALYNGYIPNDSEIYEYMNNIWLMIESKRKKQMKESQSKTHSQTTF